MSWHWRKFGALLQVIAMFATSGAIQAVAQPAVDHNPHTPPTIVPPFQGQYFGGTAVPMDPGYVTAPPDAPVDPRPEPAPFQVFRPSDDDRRS